MNSSFSNFSSVAYTFVVLSKSVAPKSRSQIFTSVFSSKSFIALTLIFRCVIYFELIFMYGVQIHAFACEYPVVPVPVVDP